MAYSDEVLADSPRGYFRLGETSGTSAADASTTANPGSYSGTYTLAQTGLITGADKAVLFNVGDVTISDHADYDNILTQITLEMWLKPDTGSLASRRELINRAGTGDDWWFNLQDSGKLSLYADNITGGVYIQSTATIAAAATTYVAVTYDGSNIRFYINGALDNTVAKTGNFNATSGNSVKVSYSASFPFLGVIDEVAFYSVALSGTRITAHYDAASAVAAPTLNTVVQSNMRSN